ncbi:MAG: hypothetical protein KC931_17520, partial [Candidatus Omnitrophica bacterium]|nr:hypothetical protein [Candidatus Omnitrophota bacterium]
YHRYFIQDSFPDMRLQRGFGHQIHSSTKPFAELTLEFDELKKPDGAVDSLILHEKEGIIPERIPDCGISLKPFLSQP